MRLNAYVLAGDPAWAGRSLSSYYHIVDRVIVSYDRHHRSWAGHPLDVEGALAALKAADPDGKIVELPGDHSDPERFILDVETEHRQAALDAASESTDWVLQLDTDEILLSPQTFTRHLEIAASRGARALDYPLRDFYQYVGRRRYLEHCGRFWTDQAAYPGPTAIQAGAALNHCRQSLVPLYRVDLAARNTDPAHPHDSLVHAVVPRDEAIAHMSWVRTDQQMLDKSKTSGYVAARDWDRDLRAWQWRRRHPWLTTLATPFGRARGDRFRMSRLPFAPQWGD